MPNQAAIGRKREKKNSFRVLFPSTPAGAFQRNSEKFKNVILASFLDKLSQDRSKKRKNKLFQEPFLPDLGWSTPKEIGKIVKTSF